MSFVEYCSFCRLDSAGQHESFCPLNPKNRQEIKDNSPIGWICPVCGRGLSPYVMVCPCWQPKTITTTTTNYQR